MSFTKSYTVVERFVDLMDRIGEVTRDDYWLEDWDIGMGSFQSASNFHNDTPSYYGGHGLYDAIMIRCASPFSSMKRILRYCALDDISDFFQYYTDIKTVELYQSKKNMPVFIDDLSCQVGQ